MRQSKYKYNLEAGSKHIICPNCGKKNFQMLRGC